MRYNGQQVDHEIVCFNCGNEVSVEAWTITGGVHVQDKCPTCNVDLDFEDIYL